VGVVGGGGMHKYKIRLSNMMDCMVQWYRYDMVLMV